MDGGTTVILAFCGLFGAFIAVQVMCNIIEYKYKYKEQEKKKAFKLLWIPVIIGLLMWIPLIQNLANSPSSRSYVCDYCGRTSEYSFTVGKQDLCYDCYQLYKKGK